MSSNRLDLLRPVLAPYRRKFSILSLGSGVEEGLEAQIVRAYPNAVVVAVEADPLRYEPPPGMIVLSRKFSPEDLEVLATCERFDVVLGMNVLHWCGKEWLRTLRALGTLGRDLVVQSPDVSDKDACGQEVIPEIQAILKEIGHPLGSSVQFPGHLPRPIYWIWNPDRAMLNRKFFTAPVDEIRALVSSDHALGQIFLTHKGREWEEFIPGLGLQNFLDLGGSFPLMPAIARMLEDLQPSDHRDIQAWNIRMTGGGLALIDPGGRDWPQSDEQNLAALVEKLGGNG